MWLLAIEWMVLVFCNKSGYLALLMHVARVLSPAQLAPEILQDLLCTLL
jgi:hypothetical protein